MYTVAETIRSLLPKGTRPSSANNPSGWTLAPPHPADVFGVAASLLKRSGVYQHILAAPGVCDASFVLLVDEDCLKRVRKAADEWRNISDPNQVPNQVSTLWAALADCQESLLPTEGDPSAASDMEASWWRAAMELMFIADEAAAGLGFFDDETEAMGWYFPITRKLLSLEEALEENRAVPPSISQIPTWLNCVLPKSRTSSLGCTLRSLSHHLCLLPAAGIASARWCDLRASNVEDDDAPLNILLVPFPYHLSADAFDPGQKRAANWDSFAFRQKWLGQDIGARRKFVQFIKDLIAGAESEVRTVDAVVFPEMALDWEHFYALMVELEGRDDVQLLIAGVRTDDAGGVGNFIATAIFYNTPDGRAASYVVRAKHHRWKLDERQIRRYALSAYLNPEKTWWEGFNIAQREIHVVRFRKNSTVAALICEDLARVDPCQELLRSIGPNLVLVLLMDGPQLKQRWSGRYATVLAEDPGSSVLTLTCLGLIDRQHESRRQANPVIALWKDDRDDAREIYMSRDDHALILSLTPKERSYCYSMDGRTRPTVAWYLGGIHPVRAEKNPYT